MNAESARAVARRAPAIAAAAARSKPATARVVARAWIAVVAWPR